MARMVLLRHTLPDGSFHFDWMVERSGNAPGPDSRSLLTFALPEPLSTEPGAIHEAVRLADHRRQYLDYQGLVSGGRGQVDRVLAGTCRIVHDSPSLITIEGAIETPDRQRQGGVVRWVCEPLIPVSGSSTAEPRGPAWRIRVEPVVPVGAARPNA